jgi:hypothetical protein
MISGQSWVSVSAVGLLSQGSEDNKGILIRQVSFGPYLRSRQKRYIIAVILHASAVTSATSTFDSVITVDLNLIHSIG